MKALPDGTRLAEEIAVGSAKYSPSEYTTVLIFLYYINFLTIYHNYIAQHPGAKAVLPPNQLSVATSYWPFQTRRNGKRKSLNRFQVAAIDLACSNEFVMIQGPPGIAYVHI